MRRYGIEYVLDYLDCRRDPNPVRKSTFGVAISHTILKKTPLSIIAASCLSKNNAIRRVIFLSVMPT